ncbi:MAG: PTS fructose transporter subunit IIC [Erysipelotrichaceae bacterium]|nr:PTS fructose transporter subunit IIC [Erysipelotrichaceae bacterium]
MSDKKNKIEIKRHVMTGISYMIPLVVAAGLCSALGQVIDPNVREATTGIGFYLYSMGSFGMNLVVPVISAFTAYSICGRLGIAPGLIMGFVCTTVKAGFIGGIVGGFMIGYFVNFLLKHLAPHVPKWMEGLLPVMIIPFLTTAVCCLLMYTVVGIPFAWLIEKLTEFLTTMSTASKAVFGAILGAICCFDFGGPVNKAGSTFVNGLLADGVCGPESVKFLGSMVPPFGIFIARILAPKKFTQAEKEQLKAAVPMGICMITEGVIPIAARDLVRVIIADCIGSAVGGALCLVWGTESPIVHGGMLTVPLFTHPWLFCLALLIGSTITGVILAIIKKPVTEADEMAGLQDLGSADSVDDSDELVVE